jgi:hypothetical protein
MTYNPTNPVADAMQGVEAILKRKPVKIETKKTGMLSKKTPSMQNNMDEDKATIAMYVQTVRDVIEENKNNEKT